MRTRKETETEEKNREEKNTLDESPSQPAVTDATPGFFESVAVLIRSKANVIFIWCWNVTVACLIAGRGHPPLIPTVKAIVSVAFIAMAVYFYNDAVDASMDRLNPFKKDRPLASGRLSQKNAMRFVYLSGFIGLVIILSANLLGFVFGFLYLVLFTMYSHPKTRLKRRFLLKESTISLGGILTALMGIYAVANSFVPGAFFASIITAIYAYVGEPALADSTDIEEDRLAGVKNLAILLSWKRKIQLLIAGMLIIMAATALTYVQFDFNVLLPILVVIGGFVFLGLMAPIMNKFEDIAVVRARKIAEVYLIFLQLSFVIGSLEVQLLS